MRFTIESGQASAVGTRGIVGDQRADLRQHAQREPADLLGAALDDGRIDQRRDAAPLELSARDRHRDPPQLVGGDARVGGGVPQHRAGGALGIADSRLHPHPQRRAGALLALHGGGRALDADLDRAEAALAGAFSGSIELQHGRADPAGQDGDAGRSRARSARGRRR